MRQRHVTHRSFLALCISVVVLAGARGTFADSTHVLRAYAGYFSASGDDTLNLGKIEYDNSAGYGVGYEYEPFKWWGIAADYGRFGTDIKASNIRKVSGDFDPITLGVNFHVVPLKTINVYLGPEAVYVRYGKPQFNLPGVGTVRVDIDNELIWGAKGGVDFKFLPWIGVGASVEYIDASAKFKSQAGNGSLDPKPVIAHAGVFLRF